MAKVRFSVMCKAVYYTELEVDDNIIDDEDALLEEIRDRLPEAPIDYLEWLDDLEDTSEAVTKEDIISIKRGEDDDGH